MAVAIRLVAVLTALASMPIVLATPFNAGPDTTTPTPTSGPTVSTPTPTRNILALTELSPIPHPWYYATIAQLSDASNACLASMTAMSQLSCGRRQHYTAYTTVGYAVPCLGCIQLTLSYRPGHCPLGRPAGQSPDTTIQATHTAFSFYCATDGVAAQTYRDVSIPLPVPTLPPDFKPAWTPTEMYATKYAEGFCYNELMLGPTDGAVKKRECEETATGPRPTVYTSTVTRTVDVVCDDCDQGVVVGKDFSYCDDITSASGQRTVMTASEPTTTWKYQCASK